MVVRLFARPSAFLSGCLSDAASVCAKCVHVSVRVSHGHCATSTDRAASREPRASDERFTCVIDYLMTHNGFESCKTINCNKDMFVPNLFNEEI